MTAAVAPRVNEAITNLGGTADRIADRLRALNIKGHQGSAVNCPLARYVQTIPGAEHAEVSARYIHLNNGEGSILLTDAAFLFRRLFDRDHGPYLDLVDPRPAGGWAEQIEGGEGGSVTEEVTGRG